MGTIFVAYGGGEHRNRVLERATELAASGDHDLLVYHLATDPRASGPSVREEISSVIREVTPHVAYEIEIDDLPSDSTDESQSKPARLLEALDGTEGDVEYVVMGDVERGPVEQFTHHSMTGAVLNEGICPVMLVPA